MKIKDLLANKMIRMILGGLFIAILSLVCFFYEHPKTNQGNEALATLIEEEKEDEGELTKDALYVDIKGAVKKPGVYKMKSGSIVNDVIKEAGGLTKNAVTSNINLSKQVTNEMVIYVFTKNQLNKTTTPILNDVPCVCETIEVNQCTTESLETKKTSGTETTKKSVKVNLNTASKEELMTVSGIGASKADAIIIYRSEQKFNSIEDVKKVSGIGDALFAKIKDSITV